MTDTPSDIITTETWAQSIWRELNEITLERENIERMFTYKSNRFYCQDIESNDPKLRFDGKDVGGNKEAKKGVVSGVKKKRQVSSAISSDSMTVYPIPCILSAKNLKEAMELSFVADGPISTSQVFLKSINLDKTDKDVGMTKSEKVKETKVHRQPKYVIEPIQAISTQKNMLREKDSWMGISKMEDIRRSEHRSIGRNTSTSSLCNFVPKESLFSNSKISEEHKKRVEVIDDTMRGALKALDKAGDLLQKDNLLIK